MGRIINVYILPLPHPQSFSDQEGFKVERLMDLSKQGDEEAPREKKDAMKGRKKEGDNYHE